jgi:hypothetical protein
VSILVFGGLFGGYLGNVWAGYTSPVVKTLLPYAPYGLATVAVAFMLLDYVRYRNYTWCVRRYNEAEEKYSAVDAAAALHPSKKFWARLAEWLYFYNYLVYFVFALVLAYYHR